MPRASKFTRSMAPSDEELVEQFQNGDSSAFDVLVRRWERKVQGAIYRLVGPGEDVRDLSQETLLKAFAALARFKPGTNFRAWLFRIAYNSFVNQRRSLARQQNPQFYKGSSDFCQGAIVGCQRA